MPTRGPEQQKRWPRLKLAFAHVHAVLRPWRVQDFHFSEPGFGQHFARELLAPDRAEPLAADGERDRHAMHEAGAVIERRERIADVVLDVAAELEIDEKERALRRK